MSIYNKRMGRLNQSRRQKIGYSYCPQVINDVAIQPKMRNMSLVQEQAFDQNMRGEGIREIIRGIIDNKERILEMGSKAVDIAASEAGKQASKIMFDAPLHAVGGSGLSPAGGGLSPAPNAPRHAVGGSGLSPAGSGLSPAGGAIDIRGNGTSLHAVGDVLPGDKLKKKLLQKMVRERRMRSLGDRVKTQPIEQGMNGGSLVIPTNNNKMGSQSRSKTLPSSKAYKLNPRPLVGAGKKGQEGGFIFAAIAAAIAAISAAASAAAATTVVGSVTVGSLVGATLTGAAGAAGAAIVKKIAGDGVRGGSLKDAIVKVAKETKISFSDLTQQDKDKIKSEFDKLKQNPSKSGVIDFAKSIAPIALKTTQKTLKPEFTEVFKKAGLSGSGLKLAGQGLGLAGQGEKQFKNEFVKNMLKQMGV
jgi:hypothetical protein